MFLNNIESAGHNVNQSNYGLLCAPLLRPSEIYTKYIYVHVERCSPEPICVLLHMNRASRLRLAPKCTRDVEIAASYYG